MSTKIYNGFKLRTGTDMFTFKANFNEKFYDLAKNAINQEAVTEIALFYDLLTYNDGEFANAVKEHFTERKYNVAGEYIKYIDLYLAAEYSAEERSEDKKKRGTQTHEENIELIINRNPRTGTILGYFYGSTKNYRKFLKMEEVEGEYSYYNNSDKPRNVTTVKWEERGLEWEETFNLDEPFSNQGLRIILLNDYDETMQPGMMRRGKFVLPSKELRLRNLTQQYLGTELKATGEEITLRDYVDYVIDKDNVARATLIVEPLMKPLPAWKKFRDVEIKNPFLDAT